MVRIATRAAFAAFVLFAACAGAVRAQELVVETAPLQVSINGRSISLEAIVVKRADATGKLPIAIITHGSPATAPARAAMRAEQMLPHARDLAIRGWLAVAFMRRGFATNAGSFAEGYICGNPNFRRALLTSAEDVEAVRTAIAKRQDADATRVFGIGHSVGGATMLAWASQRPSGLLAVANVSGGTGASPTGHNCDESQLVRTVSEFSGAAIVPSIWFYAANDNWLPPALVQRMHEGYVGRGGRATLHAFGPLGDDGHNIWFTFAGKERWIPVLDRFFRENGLPTWDRNDADALAATLTDVARPVLTRFLGAPTNKALAVSQSKGIARFWSGTNAIQAAREGALRECQAAAAEPCRIVMENFRAVP
jgi:dienelactone hydrolase